MPSLLTAMVVSSVPAFPPLGCVSLLYYLHERTRLCRARRSEHGAERGELSSPNSVIHPGDSGHVDGVLGDTPIGGVEGEAQAPARHYSK